jgi:DNA invertase Pin-like site-specific DNA recombinase
MPSTRSRARHDDPLAIVIALAYTRVSSDEQQQDGVSLDAQMADTTRYIRDHAWQHGGTFTDVLSGARDDRPAYQKVLARARELRRQGHAVVVVVTRLDRFGRDILERVRFYRELHNLQVPTHSVREGGDVPETLANALAFAAHGQLRAIKDSVRAAWTFIRNNGWYMVGTCPYGYQWRPRTEQEKAEGAPAVVLEVDPVAAAHVGEMFRRVAGGQSARSVAGSMGRLPEAERGGRKMVPSTLMRMLRNTVYAGWQDERGTPGAGHL